MDNGLVPGQQKSGSLSMSPLFTRAMLTLLVEKRVRTPNPIFAWRSLLKTFILLILFCV
jgi:hypothetical protein